MSVPLVYRVEMSCLAHALAAATVIAGAAVIACPAARRARLHPALATSTLILR